MTKLLLTAIAAMALTAGCAQVPTGSVATEQPIAQAGYHTQSVTFDPATGLGFVGKGDVQTAFGWNNALLQANAGGLSFRYEVTATYAVTYEFVTGEGKKGYRVHQVTLPRHTSFNSQVVFASRTSKQITGFNLTGLAASTTDGEVPVVGSTFNQGNTVQTCVAVEVLSSTSGLFVNYGGQSVQLL